MKITAPHSAPLVGPTLSSLAATVAVGRSIDTFHISDRPMVDMSAILS